MSRLRVLYICHNHPAVRPGGAEQYALELHRSFPASGQVESTFLAKGPPGAGGQAIGIRPAGTGDGEYFASTQGLDHDAFLGRLWPKTFHVEQLPKFLLAIQPDVVHIQHTLALGYETIRAVRATLPHAALVHTLHEYLPICHRDGQMLRTVNQQELCNKQTAQRCHECFPETPPADFESRTRFVQAQLHLVDVFIAPSRVLLERYVGWGLPREKILLEEYGRPQHEPAPVDARARRDRFTFFGQLTPYKGADVLLEAVQILRQRADADVPRPVVRIHGGNLNLQRGEYRQRLRGLLDAAGDGVEFTGSYTADELPALMRDTDWVVVPSIWWENSPLVIQEAFAHGRPVICSDVGGMAEKVRDGVDGLHFRARSPIDLARVMTRAMSEPDLWQQLHRQVRPPHSMDAHRGRLVSLYTGLVSCE